MNLHGNTILITDAGSGIGLALAEEFAKLGNEVIVAARSPHKFEVAKSGGAKPACPSGLLAGAVEGLCCGPRQAAVWRSRFA